MNGELYQMCCIAVAAKKALKINSIPLYNPLKYESKLEFDFLPIEGESGLKYYTAKNIIKWYEYCIKNGLNDIKVFVPLAVKDLSVLGVPNMTQASMVCFYDNKKITYFSSQWTYDYNNKTWNVLYTEEEYQDDFVIKSYDKDNNDTFKSVLTEIRQLACQIDCLSFATTFDKAIGVLSGYSDYMDMVYDEPLSEMPEENLRLFKASSIADVFSGKGSWTDTGLNRAIEKGLEREYRYLTYSLLKQVRLATIYAVNEW